jgi:dCMP deaminase
MTDKWDLRMLELAKHVSGWSKDPSTKVGCVIADEYSRVVLSLGYNGFPMGVPDVGLDDREYKYARTVHAEMNALLFQGRRLDGATMYIWPMPPCSRCAGPIIQAGIVRVVSPPAGERWEESCKIGHEMFDLAGVDVAEVDLP